MENELYQEIDRLKAEVEKLRTMSAVEMMCENINVRFHIQEWSMRCLNAEAEVERLKRGEFICSRCSLRKEGEKTEAKF